MNRRRNVLLALALLAVGAVVIALWLRRPEPSAPSFATIPAHPPEPAAGLASAPPAEEGGRDEGHQSSPVAPPSIAGAAFPAPAPQPAPLVSSSGAGRPAVAIIPASSPAEVLSSNGVVIASPLSTASAAGPAAIDEVTATRRMVVAHAPLRAPEVADPVSDTNREILQTMVTKAISRAEAEKKAGAKQP